MANINETEAQAKDQLKTKMKNKNNKKTFISLKNYEQKQSERETIL